MSITIREAVGILDINEVNGDTTIVHCRAPKRESSAITVPTKHLEILKPVIGSMCPTVSHGRTDLCLHGGRCPHT